MSSESESNQFRIADDDTLAVFDTLPGSVGDWGNDFASLDVCRKLFIAARCLPDELAERCIRHWADES